MSGMFRWALLSVFLGVLVLLLVLLPQGQPALAATFTVTRLDDPAPDGCAPGDCSLREAVIAANATLVGTDIIDLFAGTFSLSIAGADEDAAATGDLDITADLRINGADAATTMVEACDSSGGPCTGIDRVFHIDPLGLGINVEMSGLTVRNGSEQLGGGIYNEGILTLNSSSVSGNTVTGTLSITASGGGIFSVGTVNLNSSTVSGNTANLGTGFQPLGGGIAAYGGTVTLNNSTVSGNSTAHGGGIYNASSTVILNSSSVSGNTASTGGGGISNNQGTITLTNSTVSGNSAALGGGFINANAGAVITLTNSTVSGNSASNIPFGDGGGIYNEGETVILNSSTVSGNSASGDGGGIGGGPAGVTLKNSIVANNTPSGSNCAFTITSLGHNLDSDGSCGLSPVDPLYDLPNTNPQLAPLANYGGPTETHALCTVANPPHASCVDASPAIDTGVPTADPDCSGGNDFDQRGVPRPQGAACDIGAYEVVTTSACVNPPARLVSWWPGDGNASDIWDSNPGTLVGGATFGPGKVNDAFRFSGSGRVSLPSAPSSAEFTIDAWVYVSAYTNWPWKTIYADDAWGFWLYTAPGEPNTGRLNWWRGNVNGFVGTTPIPTDSWHHVALTYSNSTFTGYLNGNPDGSSTFAGQQLPTGSGLGIGGHPAEPQEDFIGLIDEVEVFNRALNPSEIADIYNAGSAGKCKPGACPTDPQIAIDLVSCWPEDGNANDVVDGNHPSAASGIDFVSAVVGRGVTFTVPPDRFSPGGYIDILHSTNLALQRFTIDAWVKPNGIGPNNDQYGSVIISKAERDINGVELLWRANPDRKFLFVFGNIVTDVIESSGSYPPGSFYHVAGTYDGTDFKLFVNGALQGTRNRPNYTITYNPSITWTIGSEAAQFRSIGFPRTWNGIIDEVRIFNRALTDSEIQRISQIQTGPVGGVVRLQNGRGEPAAAGSGSTAGAYSVFALAGAVASVLALVPGAWYARRRYRARRIRP